MPLPRHRGPRPAVSICRAGAALAAGILVLGGGSAGAGATPAAEVSLSVLAAPWLGGAPDALPFHARLTASTPADGSTAQTVEEVVLTFSEEVDPSFVAVTVEGPDGEETDGAPVVDGRSVTQPLASDLAAGRHVATFRVVSADGHPVSGTVRFTTQAPSSTQPSPSGAGTSPQTSPPGSPAPPDAPTASATVSGPSSPASAAETTATSWALPGLGAVLIASAIGWALWRSRSGTSDGEATEEPRGP